MLLPFGLLVQHLIQVEQFVGQHRPGCQGARVRQRRVGLSTRRPSISSPASLLLAVFVKFPRDLPILPALQRACSAGLKRPQRARAWPMKVQSGIVHRARASILKQGALRQVPGRFDDTSVSLSVAERLQRGVGSLAADGARLARLGALKHHPSERRRCRSASRTYTELRR